MWLEYGIEALMTLMAVVLVATAAWWTVAWLAGW